MNNKGFTLVELIGVVAILALVLIVSIPAVTSTLTTNTIKKVDSFHKDLEVAAQNYVENNWNIFKTVYIANQSDNYYCLSISTLTDEEYVKKTEIDPDTNQIFNPAGKYILLKNIGSGAYRFSFTYVDTDLNKNDENRNKCLGA